MLPLRRPSRLPTLRPRRGESAGRAPKHKDGSLTLAAQDADDKFVVSTVEVTRSERGTEAVVGARATRHAWTTQPPEFAVRGRQTASAAVEDVDPSDSILAGYADGEIVLGPEAEVAG